MSNLFETGAKTQASNNLILSVMNDGSIYNQRIDAGKRILQGLHPIISFREMAVSEASKQRSSFGLKFKPQEITEAGKIIQEQTIKSILEDMVASYDPSHKINAIVRRWFDKVNGNSYFSCFVTVPVRDRKNLSFVIPFQYGYGSQPEYEIACTLFKVGVLKEKKNYFREYNIDLQDQGYVRKNHNWHDGLYL